MNIIRKITTMMRAAVERFSSPMRMIKGMTTMRMNLKARLSAPSSRCMALRIWAVTSTIVPFAISEGWNFSPKRLIQRPASLVFSPKHNTHRSIITEMMSKAGVISLKKRHGIFRMTMAMATPTIIFQEWPMIGVR